MRRASRAAGLGLGALALVALAACGAADARVGTRDGGVAPPEERVDPVPTTIVGENTTTASSPTTTTTAATESVPAPEESATAWHLEGKQRGTEHFGFGNPRCPVLAHELSGSFTTADGRVLALDEVYCGVIEPGLKWRGEGTFALTAPDGSLTGTFESSAQLPSSGEPYRLDVRAGTGSFAGATGACEIDNHLAQSQFGVQEQWGTFACDLTR